MSLTFKLFVTAMASTEISSAAWRPTIEPPSTTPVAGSEMIFTNPHDKRTQDYITGRFG